MNHGKTTYKSYLTLAIILICLSAEAQSVEILGGLKVAGLSEDNSAENMVVLKSDGSLGTKNISSLPSAGVPSSGIILSTTPGNIELINAGFVEIGRQSMEVSERLKGGWESSSVVGTPIARYHHTAIWTGSEMIVWGGATPTSVFRNGGKYDPVSDSWIDIPIGPPVARFRHTAVWTGTEMIIWGGIDGSQEDPLGSGGRYTVVTGVWTLPSNTNAPSERYGHTAIWTGSEMIIWGGFDGSTAFGDGAYYDPSNDTWTQLSNVNAPTPTAGHTAVWTGSEMIIWGGSDFAGSFGSGGRYNPSTNSWTPISTINSPEKRIYHTAVWTGSKMIVWGGSGLMGALNTGGVYDPVTDSWTAISVIQAPTARILHQAVWTGAEMIIYSSQDNYLETAMYNGDADRWVEIDDQDEPVRRQSGTAIWAEDKMIIWGGVSAGGDFLNTGGKYDPNALGDYGALKTVDYYLYQKE